MGRGTVQPKCNWFVTEYYSWEDSILGVEMMQPGGNVTGVEARGRQQKNKSQNQKQRVAGRLTADTDSPVVAE